MVTAITRRNCLELYPKLPTGDHEKEEYHFPEIFNLSILKSGFNDDTVKLCRDIVDLIRRMGFRQLIFLGMTDTPWLCQTNEVPQVKEAFQYLKAQRIDESFNGGFIVDEDDLAEFLKHLFWLTRINAASTDVYFTDKAQGIIVHLCHYGNLHLFTLSRNMDELIFAKLGETQFELVEDGKC